MIKVRLREKQLKNGDLSLYLDFYPAIFNSKTGKHTRREFLGLHVPKKTRNQVEKNHKRENIQLAEQIRQKRENQYNKPEIYTDAEREQMEIRERMNRSFVDYFENLADKKGTQTRSAWLSTLKYLKTYSGGTIKFADLTESYLEGFKEYLLQAKSLKSDKTTISRNTASSYFNKVKTALKQAYKEDLLQTDLNKKITPIKEAETRREYLTMDELNRLVQTPCRDESLKRAALFSALTGMASKEIINMAWGDVSSTGESGYMVLTKRQKTGRDNYLPISEQAFGLLGEPGKPNEKVFSDLKYSAYSNKHLTEWIKDAGITKKITFHCFRHTFATLQLFNGTDIYTVSKMLGHNNLSTTQVYAKIVDEAKRDAANRIKLDF